MARALIVQILGDARQYGAELDRAAGKTRSMGKVAGVAGLAIAGGLAYGLEKSVKAGMAMQTTTAKLDAAFKAAGMNADNYAGLIDRTESASRKLGFSNLDVRDSLGSLIIATHNAKLSTKDLAIAEDLARTKHISLQDATKNMTSAMAGSARAARQLGLVQAAVKTHSTALAISYAHQTAAINAQFPPTAKMTAEQLKQRTALLDAAKAAHATAAAHASLQDKIATAAKVTDQMSQKLHGQAKAYADTAAGGMAQFHAEMEALQENLGTVLLPAIEAVTQKLAVLTDFFVRHTTIAKIVIGALALLAVTLMAVSVATAIASAATAVFGAVMAIATLPILAIIAAVVLLGVAAYEIYKHWGAISGFFKGLWNDIKGIFDSAISFVKDHWRAFATALLTIILGPLGLLVGEILSHWGQIKADAVRVWNAIKSLAGTVWGAIKDAIMAPINLAKGLLGRIWNGLQKEWAVVWSGISAAIIGPIKTIIGWVKELIHLISIIPGIPSPPSGGPASSGGTKPGQPRGPRGGRGASGGIVTQATWALIGESGPEALIPLASMPGARALGRGGGGGSPIIINVHGWVGNDQQLARHLRDQLVKIGRVEGPIFGGYA